MKSTPDNAPPAPDLSGLSTAEMADVISGLQHQLDAKDDALARQQSELDKRDERIQQRDTRIEILEELLRLKTLQKFAASSERHRFQTSLFDEAEVEAEIEALREELPDEVEPDQDEPPSPARKNRQRGFLDQLLRKRIELTLSDEEKAGASKTFFTKVKEELEFIPAQLNVLEYWQEKAVFEHDDGDESLVAAPRPVHPLGKCIATTSLLAYIITSQYADGLPLYRLETMLARLGHPLSRTSMAHWIIRLNDVCKPLIHLCLPLVAHRPDERWATDLTHVWCGKDRRAALAVIIDCCTREIPGWRLSDNGSAKTAEAALEEALIERLGVLQRVTQPLALRSDNGLVFSSCHYTGTVKAYGLTQEFTTPYTPEQNGLIEWSFRSLKEECIWQHRFESLAHAQTAIGNWIRNYNEQRPHQSLGYVAPRAPRL